MKTGGSRLFGSEMGLSLVGCLETSHSQRAFRGVPRGIDGPN